MRNIEARVIRQLFREVEDRAGVEIRNALHYLAETCPCRSERAVLDYLAKLSREAADQVSGNGEEGE